MIHGPVMKRRRLANRWTDRANQRHEAIIRCPEEPFQVLFRAKRMVLPLIQTNLPQIWVILPSPVTRRCDFEHAGETHLDDGYRKLKLKQLSVR